MNRILLIVDVNKYFLDSAPKDLAQKIRNHIDSTEYEEIVFTVFQNTVDSNFVKSLNWSKCMDDSDAELPDELADYASAHKVFKRNTYSAFAGTKLKEYLKSFRCKELEICGVDTDACVLATAFSAFDLNYRVHVNFDLTYSSNDLEAHAQAIIKESIVPQDKKSGN